MKRISHKEFYIGLSIIGFFALIALLSVVYTPYDPNAMDLANKLASPTLLHLLGTDQFGRDILSRLMVGSQLVFIVGISSVLCALLIGGILGALGGYYGGFLDELLMKLIEAKMAFPGVLLALMLISIFGAQLPVMIVALSIMNIPRFTRMIRSGYIQYREAEFVIAAKAMGISDFRIITRHILPNISQNIWVTCALSFSSAILAEAGLSYLGLGVQPPFASWGKMLNEAQAFMLQAPLAALIPGLMITLIVIGFNFLADGLQHDS